jgi:hypothetical protein
VGLEAVVFHSARPSPNVYLYLIAYQSFTRISLKASFNATPHLLLDLHQVQRECYFTEKDHKMSEVSQAPFPKGLKGLKGEKREVKGSKGTNDLQPTVGADPCVCP